MNLLAAIQYNNMERVRLLVEQGADKDKCDGDGWPPLSAAAANGRLEVARYLLEQGADRDKTDSRGYTPLHWSVVNGRIDVTMLLRGGLECQGQLRSVAYRPCSQ